MRHHHVAKALALTLLCLLLVPGCEQGDEPVQVALILSGASGHYWENIVEGAQTAAERMDIPLRCYMPDEEKEIRLEDLPAQAARDGADALVVASQGQQELLDALEALDVPATFFLVGLGVRAFPEYARQIVQAGHAVGCHTMGHAAGAIKKDEDFVLRDIGRFNKMMSEEIEPGFSTDLFRFPGGSSSYKARIKAKVRDAGYAWFDWNTMTGDAQYSFSSDREMLEYTLGQAHGKDVVILLMHEGKTRTRRILPELVAYFRENGYEFRRLSTGEEDREILSRCGAHFMLPDAEQGGH